MALISVSGSSPASKRVPYPTRPRHFSDQVAQGPGRALRVPKRESMAMFGVRGAQLVQPGKGEPSPVAAPMSETLIAKIDHPATVRPDPLCGNDQAPEFRADATFPTWGQAPRHPAPVLLKPSDAPGS